MPNNTVNQPPIFRDLERQRRTEFNKRSSVKPILGLGGPYSRDFGVTLPPSSTPTLTPTITPGLSPTKTPTPTPTPTKTPTPTVNITQTPTRTPTPSVTPTRTPTPTFPLPTPTPTPTDIVPIIGKNASYVGFTAGTGAGRQQHTVYKFEMTNAYNSFYYDRDFNMTDFKLNGSCGINFDNSVFLTLSLNNQSGSIFYKKPFIFISETDTTVPPFSAYFEFNYSLLAPNGTDIGAGAGADGMTFCIQSLNNTVGGPGGGLGYKGILSSICVEFDNYNNYCSSLVNDCIPPNRISLPYSYTNHLGLNINGSLISNPVSGTPISLNEGNIQLNYCWIYYENNTITVYLTDTPTKPEEIALYAENVTLTGCLFPL